MPSPWVNISILVLFSMYTILLVLNFYGLSSNLKEESKKQLKISYLNLLW